MFIIRFWVYARWTNVYVQPVSPGSEVLAQALNTIILSEGVVLITIKLLTISPLQEAALYII